MFTALKRNLARMTRVVGMSVLVAVGAPQVSAQAVVVTETFTGTSAPGWVLGKTPSTTFSPGLTASMPSTGDTVGNGWLRLTDNANNEATFAYDSTAFSSANATIAATFKYASYNGSTPGADGITFFLADGSKTFAVGAYGGSLGYAQMTAAGGAFDNPGMTGGYIGLGIDEYGNYSTANEGKVGGFGSNTAQGAYPNAIAVRGPGNGLVGYDYLGGTGPLATPISFASSVTRPTGADERTIQVIVTATNQLTVFMQAGTTGAMQELYSIDLSAYARPDTLVMGFTSGTGGKNDYHEIQGLTLTSLAANLWTNTAGTSTWASSSNWDGSSGVIPAAGADILLDNHYVNSAQTIDVGTTRVVRSIQVDAPFSYTLNNGTIEFNNQGILGPSGIFVSQGHGTAAHTINSAILADNAIMIKNMGSSALNLTGALNTNGNTVTLNGNGSGLTTLSGVISGAGSVVKNDSGTALLTGYNTYTGGTTLNAGRLTVGDDHALGDVAQSVLTMNGGTLAASGSRTIQNNIILQGNAELAGINSAGTLTQTGGNRTLLLSGSAAQQGSVLLSNDNTARTLTVQVDSGTATISGAIQNGGYGSGNLTKTGAGTLALTTTNQYTGTTTINAGTIQLGGASPDVLSINSSLNMAGGTLDLANHSQKISNLSFSNGGTLDFGATSGANTFVFGNIGTQSDVLTIKNFESQAGMDLLATTTSGLNVGNIYFSGLGVAAEDASTSSVGAYGSAYLIKVATQSWNVWQAPTGTTTWGRTSDWSSGAIPNANGALAMFSGTTANAIAGLGANRTLTAIRFDNTAKAYTINNNGAAGGANRTLILDSPTTGGLAYIQQQSGNTQSLAFKTLQLNKNVVMDVTGGGDLAISALITGSTNLYKEGEGAGKLVLSGANTGFGGNIFINSGTLQIANGGALGLAGGPGTTVADGATLETTGGISSAEAISLSGQGYNGGGAIRNFSGSNTLTGALTLLGDARINSVSGTLTLTGNLTSANNSDLTFGGAGNITVGTGASGAIQTGTGTVTIDGTGTVTFTGGTGTAPTPNTYTGTTFVNSGTLVLSKVAATAPTAPTNAIAGNLVIGDGDGTTGVATVRLGVAEQINNSSSVIINSDGVLNLNGLTETIGALSGSGSIDNTAAVAASLKFGDTTNTTFSGTIADSGSSTLSLTKDGPGKVTLTGANSYTGTTTISRGTIAAQNSNALGGAGGAAVGLVTIANGAALELSGASGNLTVTNAITLDGSGTLASNGAIESTSGNNALTGTIKLNGIAGGSAKIQSDAGTLTLSGASALTSATAAQSLNFDGAGDIAVSKVIGSAVAANNISTISKDGTGTLTLSGANLYSGATTINAGNLVASGGSAIGDASAVTIATGATLTSSANNETVGSIAGGGSVALGAGSVTLTAGGNNTSTTFSGAFTGGSSTIFQKSGSGALTLTGASGAMIGNVTVSGGGLTLNNASGSALGAVNNITIGTGGTLTLGAANQINDAATLTLAGGTFNVGSFSETMKSVSQTSASTIDFLNDGSVLRFNGVVGLSSGLGSIAGGTLTIANWAGSLSGSGSEQLVFYSAAAPTVTNINFVNWGAGNNATTIARLDLGAGFYELLPNVLATDWNVNGNGVWAAANGANWVGGGTPNGAAAIARFGNLGSAAPLTTNPTVDVTGNQTVNKLLFDNNSGHNYTISSSNASRVDLSAGALVNVSDNNSHLISVASQFAGDATITNGSSATTGLTLSGTLSQMANSTLTFNGGGNTLVSGAITRSAGVTNLVKTGNGTLTLSNAGNSYTGTTTLRSGSLIVKANAPGTLTPGALGNATSAVIVNDAGTTSAMDTSLLIGATGFTVARAVTVGAQGNTTTLGGNILTGTGAFTGNIALNKSVNLEADGTANITFSTGVISGTGGITKVGSGAVTLSGANTYGGATTISAGTLQLGAVGAIPNGSAVAMTGANTTFALANNSETIGSLDSSQSTAVVSLGSATLTTGGDNTSTLFAGSITGTGGMTKAGTGTMTLTGNSTFTGVTSVTAGMLVAGSNNALGFNPGGTVATVTAGATLGLQGGSAISSESLTLNGAGASSNGALYNVSGNNTWNGAITLGTASTIKSDGGTLTLNGAIGATALNLALDGTGNILVAGAINTTTGTLIKNGSGYATLAAANGYTGTTTVTAGTLEIQNSGSLGTSGTSVANSATLALSGGITASDALTINGPGSGALGAIRSLSGANTISSTITLGSDSSIGVDAGSLTSSNLISGAFGFSKVGAGTLILTANNSTGYTGTTTVSAGTLDIRIASALGAGAGIANVTDGGTLLVNGSGLSVAENLTLAGNGAGAVGSLLGTGGNNTWTGTIGLTNDASIGSTTGTTLTATGVISGGFNLIKANAGGLVLSNAANSYSGTTILRNGTLTATVNAPDSANGAFGNSGNTIQVGDNGTAAGDNLSLLLGNAAGGLAVGRTISVNNFGNAVTIGGTNTTGTNTFSGDIAVGKNTTFSAAGGTVAFTGILTGSGGIATAGSGTITLSGNNSYGGATTVASGTTLVAANSNALGATAAVTVASGGTLGLQGNITIPASQAVTLAGTGVGGLGALRGISGDNTVSGNIALGAATTIGNATVGTNLTLGGTISGTQNLTTAGAGDITFAGANNITGTVTLGGSAGANANLASTGSFGSGVSTITINSGNTLILGAANQVSGQTNLALAGGTLNVGGFANSLRQVSNTAAGGTLDYLNDGSKLTLGSSVLGVDGRGSLLGTLNIANWAGSLTGSGSEQLIVYSAAGAPSVTNINFSGWGSGAAAVISRSSDLGVGYYELVPSVTAIDWKTNANGTWGTGTNWVGNTAPNAVGAIVGFRNAAPLTVNPTVDLQANATAGVLLFDTGTNNKSYTLTTSIAGGRTLTMQATSGNAQINVNDDAAHVIGGSSATAKLTLQSNSATVITNNATQAAGNVGLTINANTILAQNSAASLTVTGTGTTKIDGTITQLAGSTALVKTGSGNLVLGGVNTYTGTTTVRSGTLQVNVNAPSGAAGALGNSATAVIVNDASTTSTMDSALLIGASGVTVARAVTVGSQGNTTTLGGNHTTGTSTFSGAITLNKDVSLIAASGGTTTFSGQLIAGTGTQNITKEGLGTVILSNAANNYNGATIINGGTLQLGAAGVITDTSAVTMTGANTTFALANFNETIASLASSQTTATVSLGSGTLTTGGNNTSTQFDGTITGTGGLTKNGTGTMILTGNNTYSGLTSVNAGTLVAASNNALGFVAGGSTTTVAAGATVGVQGGITVSVETLNLAAATSPTTASLANLAGTNSWTGNISLTGGTANDQVKFDAASGTQLTLSGIISEGTNAKAFTKTGAGTIVLSGAADNTFTGATNVTAGTLVVGKSNALGAVGTAATTTVGVGATLGAQGGITVASTKSLALNGSTAPSSAILRNVSGTNAMAGDITLVGGAGTGVIIDSADAAGGLTLSGAIAQATSNNFVTKTGSGSLTLSGGTHNVFAGGFNINDGVVIAAKTAGIDATGRGNVTIGDGTGGSATLQLNASNQIKDSSAVTINTDGQLNLQSNSDTIGSLTMSGGSVIGSGTLTLGGDLTFNGSGSNTATISSNINLGGTRTFQVGNNGVNGDYDLTLSGGISGTGNLTKQGAGTLALSGANTFVGTTVISAGTIVTTASNVFNSTAQMTIASGAKLALLNTAQTIGSLTGAGTVDFGTSGILTLSSGSTTFSGLFTGTGELIIGAGATLTLGANFNATNLKITLAGGSLFLAGTNSTFGTLNVTSSSILDFGGSGVNSRLTVANATLNAGVLLTVNNWSDGADAFYATTSFVQNGGPSAVPDARGSTPENQVGFTGFSNNSTAWLGYDHQITPVPESATYGALFLGACLGLLGWHRWKRRQQG